MADRDGLDELDRDLLRGDSRSGLPDLNWCFGSNLFRFVAIMQGIIERARDGNASSASAFDRVARLHPMAEDTARYALEAGAR